MKKRIVAAALAAVLVCGIIGLRPKAAPAAAAGAIVTIGVFAWQLIGVMTGEYDSVAKGIGYVIENGVEGFENIGEFLSNDVAGWLVDGWNSIFNQSQEWYESGDITVTDDGHVILKYSQYLELYDLIGSAAVTDTIELVTDIPYLLFKAESGVLYTLDRSICINSIDEMGKGCYYVPVLYSQDALYFSTAAGYWLMNRYPGKESTYSNGLFNLQIFDLSTMKQTENYGGGGGIYSPIEDIFANFKPYIGFSYNNINLGYTDVFFNGSYSWTDAKSFDKPVSWYKWDGSGALTPADSLELAGTSTAILNCQGDYITFLKSITSYVPTVAPSEFDDLSGVLPLDKTKDPTLEIDTDPSIANPNDAVTVKDVPGTPDMTLSDYKAQTRLDIDIPSVISTKFPFCIPYDLIRILGVFCADSKAPVFRIPISTDPAQLEPFKGNQTVGEIPEDFEPMFEIDEELVIDLSVIPLVQPICYTVFIVGFVLLLIHITPKMINH